MLPTVSILICTRNRAVSLKQTLESIGSTRIPSGFKAELIVVDNGSTDDTRQNVEQATECGQFPLPVHYVYEKRPGNAYARNTALATARHNVLLWTDDDVVVPRDWIAPMTTPILQGVADVVAGGVQLPSHLRRPWLQPWQESLLASTTFRLNKAPLQDAVGANMAFGRHVLTSVPEFDIELGPGGPFGCCVESQFIGRLVHQGYTVVAAPDMVVDHHFDPSRLERQAFVSHLEKLGRSMAYIKYHWRHEEHPFQESLLRTRLRIAVLQAKYALKKLVHRSSFRQELPTWESYYVREIAFLRQSLIERRRLRTYATRFAPKRRPALPAAH